MSIPAFVLHPAARVLWRAPDAVQVELGDEAVIVDGVASHSVHALLADRPAHDGGAGLPASAFAAEAFRTLVDGGFLRPRPDTEPDPQQTPPSPRLAADLLALSVRRGAEAGAILVARRQRIVGVEGSSRVATQLAATLAAAGIGRVYLSAATDVRLHQAAPGGLTPGDEGRRFAAASADALRRAAPDVDPAALPMGEWPDLVVLAVDEPIDPERRDALHAAGCPHLAVRLGLDSAAVGPLVVPEVTSCLTCADLHRRDRDAAWPALAVQLTVAPRRSGGSDVVLATLASSLGAQQALAFLDGGAPPATANGTVEVGAGDWQVRRRSRPPHPDCDCGAGFGARPAHQ